MLHLNIQKINLTGLLAALCALITLVPVLNFVLAVPGELLLALGAWVLSNGLISAFLFFYSRLNRSLAVHS